MNDNHGSGRVNALDATVPSEGGALRSTAHDLGHVFAPNFPHLAGGTEVGAAVTRSTTLTDEQLAAATKPLPRRIGDLVPGVIVEIDYDELRARIEATKSQSVPGVEQ